MSSSLFPEMISELHRRDLLNEAAAVRFARQAVHRRQAWRLGRFAGRIRRSWPATPRHAN